MHGAQPPASEGGGGCGKLTSHLGLSVLGPPLLAKSVSICGAALKTDILQKRLEKTCQSSKMALLLAKVIGSFFFLIFFFLQSCILKMFYYKQGLIYN
jgi:cation transporter-like permease